MAEGKSHSSSRDLHAAVEQYQRLEPVLTAGQPTWLTQLRRDAIDHFRRNGLPATGHEDWRFTPLTPLTRLPFHPLTARPADPVDLAGLILDSLPGPRLVFVDGHFRPDLSTPGELPTGVTVRSLAEVLAGEPDRAARTLGKLAPPANGVFPALNLAFCRDGAVVQVPPGVQVDLPIQLLFLSRAAESGATAHIRNLIQIGDGARATVLEHYHSLGSTAHVTNTVTELQVGHASKLEHLKFQNENPAAVHLGAWYGEFGRASQARLHSFALGARLARNDIRTLLAGEGLECILNGLYLTRGEQLADHHMIVDHAQPRCASHEYFNGILDDKSRGVFHGRILVRTEAQKTDAKQTNKNILLSDDATVNTKPQLEIYADDVRCTHGATVGQLNQDSIFYLRSRGIGLDTARRMLIHAFAGEIIERVQCEPLRELLDRVIWTRLEQNPHVSAVAAGK